MNAAETLAEGVRWTPAASPKTLTTDDIVAFVRRELAAQVEQADRYVGAWREPGQADTKPWADMIDLAAERAGACGTLALLCVGRDEAAVQAIQDETHLAVLRLLRQSRGVRFGRVAA